MILNTIASWFGYAPRKEVERLAEEKKIILQELQLAQQAKRDCFDMNNSLAVGIFRTDDKLNITYVNSALTQMFTQTSEDMLKTPCLNLFAKNERLILQRMIKQSGSQISFSDVEYTGLKPDGSTFPVLVHLEPQDKDEEIQGFIGSVVDISKRKEYENELESKERQYQKLIDNLGEMIVVAQNGKIALCNRRAADFFDADIHTITSVPFTEWIHEEDHTIVMANYKKRLEDPNYTNTYTFRLKNRKGRILWVKISSVQIPWKGEKATLNILTDIEDRIQMEERLKVATREAEMAARKEADFLANMSHEIRTPMNGIIGLSEIILDTDLSIPQREYVSMLQKSATGLLRIINEILDYSKLDSEKMNIIEREFNLHEAMKYLFNSFREGHHKEGVNFTYCFHNGTPYQVMGDETRIKQIVTNLLSNAVKFTEEGFVTFDIHYEEDTQEFVFKVSDTGIGIPEDMKDTIFNSFEQVDSSHTREYEGTGLGLSITKKLVELMGGNIQVESKVNMGTLFIVSIPLQAVVEEEVNPGIQTSLLEANGDSIFNKKFGLHALVVEDNHINYIVAQNILKRMGCTCDHALNGSSAVDILKNQSYDIVFMDLQMPGMNGFETTKVIRDATSGVLNTEVPIIALTANAMVGASEKCLEAGMNDYLSKPILPKSLIEILSKFGDNRLM